MTKRSEIQIGKTAIVIAGGWSIIGRVGKVVSVDGDVVAIQTANGNKIIRNYKDIEVLS